MRRTIRKQNVAFINLGKDTTAVRVGSWAAQAIYLHLALPFPGRCMRTIIDHLLYIGS